MTTERACGCGTPVHDTAICGRCENQLRQCLGDQVAYETELTTTLTRMVRMSAPSDGSRGNSLALDWKWMGDRPLDTITPQELRRLMATLPPARPAADALRAQRELLASWCRLLTDVFGMRRPRAETVRSMSLHLEGHLDVLRNHEAGWELVSEMRELSRRIIQVIDTPTNRMRIKVGPCPEDDEGGDPCVGEVIAVVPWDDREPVSMECTVCKSRWERDHTEIHQAANRIRARMGKEPVLGSLELFTVKEAAMIAGVPERRLRRAIKTGKVEAIRLSEHSTLVRIELVTAWRDGEDSMVLTDRSQSDRTA